jgi:hypothetical protein
MEEVPSDMEVNFWLISLPAMIALALKGGIYAYARFSRTHSLQTRLYLFTLFFFSMQNVAEIAHFYTFIERGLIPTFEVNVFYASTIIAYAFLFHLALTLVFDAQRAAIRTMANAVYIYAAALVVLLFFTPWLISGYTPIRQYTVTRIPGPLYGAFEIYAIGICLTVVGILAYGVRRQASASERSRAKIVLIAIIPLNLVLIAVLVALHTGVRLFNASVTMPIALMFFLALTAYATHQYRLFDIQYFIPWSKVRKRKTAFYDRIRAMIAEIADLTSVNQVVSRLADTLRCPVALVGGPSPVLSSESGVLRMLDFPADALRKIDQIVIANEIAQAAPVTHRLMKQHGVAAIVPFYPHSRTAASWMLLGDSFNEQVYTPLDFKMVEQLFAHMAEQFLDKLLFLRSQLHEARDQLQTLQYRLDEADGAMAKLREQNALLRQNNFRLLRERSDTQTDADPAKPARVLTLAPVPAQIEKSLDEYVSQFEARLIAQALKRCGGNKSQAARMLGLRANTLHYKIERYGLTEKGKLDDDGAGAE